ncbi:Mpo1 family 2-hydroxy fatty acid dioxygenase [Trinickia acidisoli]|uniref:Mpo1 family 2-hydroxy fatty acid dioxygenase n=1 Tax=Trinickia acidisoli TaxID=2767482 RepID=UPI001A90AB7F|nr:Mpo1-like protein [Trinickia acidisoli]
MKSLTDQLAQYASYHRDRRNIATHFVGIPMIVLALAVLLSRPQWSQGPHLNLAALSLAASPALVLFGCAAIYYIALDVALGLVMAIVSVVCLVVGAYLAQASVVIWAGSGAALFIVGWVFQFVGHVAYEHRKPAFADDLIGLIIGPLFVLAEIAFGLGWRSTLRDSVERQASALRENHHTRHQPI